jgi:MFS family permease
MVGGARIEARVWIISGGAVLGMSMAMLDATIVNVALATIGSKLQSPIAETQWVVTGYTLALAAVIPISGWGARRFGAKQLFVISLALFAIGSALCGLATSPRELIAFRVIEGSAVGC